MNSARVEKSADKLLKIDDGFSFINNYNFSKCFTSEN